MTKAQPEVKIVTAPGFHDGHRLRRGDTFTSTKGHTASWFKPLDSDDHDAKAALNNEPSLLDLSVREIVEKLPGLTNQELQGLRQDEINGKTRKGLLAKIDDEIANRIGKTPEELEERADDMME